VHIEFGSVCKGGEAIADSSIDVDSDSVSGDETSSEVSLPPEIVGDDVFPTQFACLFKQLTRAFASLGSECGDVNDKGLVCMCWDFQLVSLFKLD